MNGVYLIINFSNLTFNVPFDRYFISGSLIQGQNGLEIGPLNFNPQLPHMGRDAKEIFERLARNYIITHSQLEKKKSEHEILTDKYSRLLFEKADLLIINFYNCKNLF